MEQEPVLSGQPDSSYGSQTATVAPAPDPIPGEISVERRVLVTGASGFVGRHLVKRLLARGHRVRGLSRSPPPPGASSGWRIADVADAAALRGSANGCDVVVHLVGIAEERDEQTFDRVHVLGTRNIVDESRRCGVERFVLLSATGADPAGSPFFRTKHEAETAVLESGLSAVVLRPSVIYGPGDRFITGLATLLRRLPVYPMLGYGAMRLRPIAIEDVGEALTQTVEREELNGVIELFGPESLRFDKIVRIVAKTLGLRRSVLPLPRALASPVLWTAAALGLPQPITAHQIAMFCQPTVLRRDENSLRRVFGIEPLPFRDAIADYLGPF